MKLSKIIFSGLGYIPEKGSNDFIVLSRKVIIPAGTVFIAEKPKLKDNFVCKAKQNIAGVVKCYTAENNPDFVYYTEGGGNSSGAAAHFFDSNYSRLLIVSNLTSENTLNIDPAFDYFKISNWQNCHVSVYTKDVVSGD